MKQLKLVALAASILALNPVSAVAEETEFKAPDISSKLNRMVEEKMHGLISEIYIYRVYVPVAERINNQVPVVPGSCEIKAGYDTEETNS